MKCINKYDNVVPRERSQSSRGSVVDLRLLLSEWTRDDRPHMSDFLWALTTWVTHIYMHTHSYTNICVTSTRSMHVRSYKSTHIIQLSALHYNFHDREAHWILYICPSLVFDMSLCLYHSSVDTGVWFYRNNMFIPSTKQRDHLTLKTLCLSLPSSLSSLSISIPAPASLPSSGWLSSHRFALTHPRFSSASVLKV